MAREVGVDVLHEVLEEMGIFQDGYGPKSYNPVEAFGILKTGEFVWFSGTDSQLFAEIRQGNGNLGDIANHNAPLLARYELAIEELSEEDAAAISEDRLERLGLDRLPAPGQPYRTVREFGARANAICPDTAALLLRRWLREYLTAK